MPSVDSILIMILGYLMPGTGTYVTAKSTPSIMDETSAQVFK